MAYTIAGIIKLLLNAGLRGVMSVLYFCPNGVRERYGEYPASLRPAAFRMHEAPEAFFVRFLVFLTSVGAGAMVLLLFYPKMSSSAVVGSDIAHGIGHWLIGSLDLGLLWLLLLGSFPGVIIGTYATRCAPEGALRSALLCALCRVGVRLVW